MLSARDLCIHGLEPVSLDLPAGECLAVMGPSGAGKSLLLRALADLDPNRGDVRLDEMRRSAVSAPRWRRQVTYVAADSGWWADRVGDHLSAAPQAAALVEELGLPRDALDWMVQRLSTGEKQRLALARAVMQAPPVLLLDEPTSALDPVATQAVESVLRRLLDGGTAVLLVTHDARQAARLARRVLRIEGGKARETRL